MKKQFNYKNIMKITFASLMSATLLFGGFDNLDAFAGVTYFNYKTNTKIKNGINLEKSVRITENGPLDISVLKIALNTPGVSVSTIKSKAEYGLKESTTKIATDNGAVAAINGDFFGMAGSYSIPLGLEMSGEKILSIDAQSNAEGSKSATFFMDKNLEPFINYVSSEVHFLNNGVENINVVAVNKVFDLWAPVIITREAMTTTADFDARVKDSFKIVVENDVITYISLKGETVEIPENGYIVMMNATSAQWKLPLFSVGQKAEKIIRPTVDLSTINNAITGAGKILSNGVLAKDGAFVPSGFQPRTAIGISKDKKNLILMVVDGRTYSVGASQNVMADLMLEYGAFEAMHLDGGGSSAMAVKKPEGDAPTLVNTPSDGSQRKVINALGVFSDNTVTAATELVITTPAEAIINGTQSTIGVHAVDANLNKIEVPLAEVVFSVEENKAVVEAGKITPNALGKIKITATHGGLTGSKEIKSVELAEINPEVKEIKTAQGSKTALSFKAKGSSGEVSSVSAGSLSYEVVPAELGVVENGEFISKSVGSGYIKVSKGNAFSYIKVYSNLASKLVTDFENPPTVKGGSYPETFETSSIYSADYARSGLKAVEMNYKFKVTGETQAAYSIFSPAIAIEGKPASIKLGVYGDSSGKWLRGKLIDANEKEFTIDFTKNINWNEYKEVEAQIPEGVAFPVSLERVYVVSTKEDSGVARKIFFDDLSAMYLKDSKAVEVPADSKMADALEYKDGQKVASSGDITFFADATLPETKTTEENKAFRNKVITSAKTNATPVHLGLTPQEFEGGGVIQYENGYKAQVVNGTTVISIGSKNSSITGTSAVSWADMANDIKNMKQNKLIIHTQTNPLNFKFKDEFNLLHELLKQASERGIKVFVVSNQGASSSVVVKDSVRYINVPAMFVSDYKVNSNYVGLRFKIDGDNILYGFEKMK